MTIDSSHNNPTNSYKSQFGLQREMGYTRQEFFNVLPSAFSDYIVVVENNEISIELSKGVAWIKVGDERQRYLTDLISFPILPVEISFVDSDEAVQALFLQRFDQCYMKGLA